MNRDIQSRQFGLILGLVVIASVLSACSTPTRSVYQDPLPSWNDGSTKQAIVAFVARVTTADGADFVPMAERIATFDNDGTLWTEQPIYNQFAFMLDRVKALAPTHPEWKEQQPFKAVLDGNLKTLMASGEQGLMTLAMATHRYDHR